MKKQGCSSTIKIKIRIGKEDNSSLESLVKDRMAET